MSPLTTQPTSVGAAIRKVTKWRNEDIVPRAQIVERILDQILPDWRNVVSTNENFTINRWCQHREAAQHARVKVERKEEVDANLGNDLPQLSVSQLHSCVWSGARSLWESGHYREAVVAAAIKINAETQNKTRRRDVAETELFKNVFTIDEPKPNQPRLRVFQNDGSKTYQSVHRGIMAFAEGCYAAIRNPIAHEEGEISQNEALEQLAAFSILARWVDTAELVSATRIDTSKMPSP